jgi:nicotinamidase-related amidase
MPIDLSQLAAPDHTALLTMELQRGVAGDLAMLPQLREELLAAGVIDNVARLCAAAREVGVRVVHNTAVNRADRAGGAVNCRMLAASAKHGGLIEGSPEAEVLLELGRDPRDIEIARYHGMTPFTSTSLDQILRNRGVTTVVATGNSVNIGVLGLVMVAVDLGYQVVVVRDAVAGVPKAYADAVLDNTIALLATIVTTDELLAAWS